MVFITYYGHLHSLQKVRNAFTVMDLVPEQVQEVMSVLSAILHLGNLTFVAAAGAQIGSRASLDAVANLLSLDSYRLGDALTKKFMVLRGEEITTPLTVEQVSLVISVSCSHVQCTCSVCLPRVQFSTYVHVVDTRQSSLV